MKEYVKNMKEYYKEICQYIGFGTPISIWVLGLGKISSHPPPLILKNIKHDLYFLARPRNFV